MNERAPHQHGVTPPASSDADREVAETPKGPGRVAMRLPIRPVLGVGDRVGGALTSPGPHCWEIVKSSGQLCGTCEECYAYHVQRDCWVLWALREPGYKPCCQKVPDCGSCPVLIERLKPRPGQAIQIHARAPSRAPAYVGRTKKVCQYLDVVGVAADEAENVGDEGMIRALQARSGVMRCRLRGVHLDYDYMTDVCVSAHPEECVFLDDAQPEVRVTPPGEVETPPLAQQALEKQAPSTKTGVAKQALEKQASSTKYPLDGPDQHDGEDASTHLKGSPPG